MSAMQQQQRVRFPIPMCDAGCGSVPRQTRDSDGVTVYLCHNCATAWDKTEKEMKEKNARS